jgi:hypothetical protein
VRRTLPVMPCRRVRVGQWAGGKQAGRLWWCVTVAVLTVLPAIGLPSVAFVAPQQSSLGGADSQRVTKHEEDTGAGTGKIVRVGKLVVERETAEGRHQIWTFSAGPVGPVTLKCGQEYRHTEPTEGTLGLRFQCLPSYGVLNWDFTLSPSQRAQIPLGNVVSESGLSWTRNGAPGAKNAPHPAEPSDYWFHGTMNPVSVGDTIFYEDTCTYPNTFGSETTLKVVGTVHLEEY